MPIDPLIVSHVTRQIMDNALTESQINTMVTVVALVDDLNLLTVQALPLDVLKHRYLQLIAMLRTERVGV